MDVACLSEQIVFGPEIVRGDLGQRHFGQARLGDQRRTARLVKSANKILEHPGGSLPQKMKDHKDLIALYRLVDRPETTHAAVIESHCQRTRQLMGACKGVVLVIHDTTELDYTTRTVLKKMGPLGNGSQRGYLCHNSLAVTPQRQVIGLAQQTLAFRREVPEGETPQQKREHPQRESRLWMRGCQAIGSAPEGCQWVDIADRGADTFEFLDYEHREGRQYVVRSAKDRCLEGEDHIGSDRVHEKLHEYVRDLPELGQRTVRVNAEVGKKKGISSRSKVAKQRKEREAKVRIAAGPVRIEVPHFARGECEQEWLGLWVVHVLELDPPAGEEALEWILLTNVAADRFEQACERVDWYCCRPMVEELHKGMKTGCGIENPQFEAEERLEPVIGLLSVTATVLLQLRQAGRDPQAGALLATVLVPLLWVQVLSAWRYGQVREETSVLEFCMALARLGGHQNRKGDGLPGWLTLWRGWCELQAMIRGVEVLRKAEAMK